MMGLTASKARSGPLGDLRLIVVGAQKGGSTAVAAALAQHPALYLPRDETPLFEGDLFTPASITRVSRLLERAEGRLPGIKRPELMLDPQAPARILATVRDPLIVATLRDPVHRAISAYWWYVQMGYLPLCDIDTGMRALLEARAAGRSVSPRSDQILEFGMYGAGLGRFRRVVGSERMIVLLPEDLRHRSWARPICDALGVDAVDLALPRSNVGTYDHRRLTLLRLRAPLFPDSQSSSYYAQKARVRYRAGRVVARIINEIDRRWMVRLSARPVAAPSDEIVADLMALYRSDSEALSEVMGRPVPWLDAWSASK